MPQLTVYCFCAAWCRTCDAYAPIFRSLTEHWSQQVRCVWIDIEEHADVIGDVDIENFPSLLILDDEDVVFFGPVLPNQTVASHLIRRFLQTHSVALPSIMLKQLGMRLSEADCG